MTALAQQLGLADRELVALVGGGGKSTMLFRLGDELAAAGRRVLLTTTTKMGRDQAMVTPTVCWDTNTRCVVAALNQTSPVMLVAGGDDHKVTGPSPEVIDRLFATSAADYIIVEADGSRRRPLKAPASHEPVVPATSTTVVILMGIDAVGRPLAEVTHRVEQAMHFTGLAADHILTPRDCAAILTHPDGALRVCPPTARVIVALTKAVTTAEVGPAAEIERLVTADDRIDSCLQIGTTDT